MGESIQMSIRLKLCGAFVCFALGCFFAGRFALGGGYANGLATFFSGGLTAAVVVFGIEVRNSVSWLICAAIFTGLSIYSVFFETPGFDIERQQIQIKLLPIVLDATQTSGNPWGLSPTALKVAEAMGFACLIQGSTDTMSSIVAAQKAISFGPGMTMADAAVDTLEGKTTQDRCMDGFKKLYREKPLMFSSITRKYAKWLKSNGMVAQ
jgi:hypothetical protein